MDAYNTANSMCLSQMDTKLQNLFSSASTLHACATKDAARVINKGHLNLLGDVATIRADDVGKHTKNAAEVSSIPRKTHLACECKCMLISNYGPDGIFWGLFNGAVGTVKWIWYAPGRRPPALPDVVYVNFPGYTGPAWLDTDPTIIPIVPKTFRCEYNCCTRTQVPLVTAAALTIHKCQGMTVGQDKTIKKVVVDPGSGTQEKKQAGLLFVGLSRAQTKDDVAFALPAVDLERITAVRYSSTFKKRHDEIRRLALMSQRTSSEFSSLPSYQELLRQVMERGL